MTSPPTAVGPPNPQTMTTAQPVMPLPQAPNFQQQLRVFANNIRRANPNADPADIGEAVMGYAKLIQTDNSQENRLLAVQMQQQNAFDRTVAQLQNRLDVVSQQQSGATSRTQMQVGSREKIAAARDAIAQSAVTGADIPPEAKVFLAQELIAGNLQGVNEALGFSRNRAAILGQVIQAAQAIQPGFNGTQASAALAQFGGQKTAAGVVGRTAGATAVGANEIGQLKPLIMQVAQKINTSQFPTVNAIENAVRAGTGNPDVVQLRSYVQTLRNAYQQIAARGGRMTDQVRRYGEELINGNMPIAQLGAAADAMANEATVVKGATAGAMQDVTGRQPAAAPTGGDDGWGVERVQ